MKLPRSSPDKLPAEGNNRFRKLLKSPALLNLNKMTISIQIITAVITNIKKIDFCKEKYNINGQNRLNKVVIIHFE